MMPRTRVFAAITVGATFLLLASGELIAAGTPSTPARTAIAKKPSAAQSPAPAPKVQLPALTAAQIMEKHLAARGGAQAWKEVQALQLSGKMDAGKGDNYTRAMKMVDAAKKESGKATAGEVAAASPKADNTQVALPFTLDLKRPNKSRLEIQFAGKTAVQVYDGEHGWKVRPFLNRTDAEPFTADEAKTEASRDSLDGPLIGSASSGAKVTLDGTDLVDGQGAYRLKVTYKNGDVKRVWIDGKTFLDIKMDGFPHRMDGKVRAVYVYQRDFHSVQGVIIPFEMETVVDGYPDKHKMTIEKAAVNPRFDDALFAKPHA